MPPAIGAIPTIILRILSFRSKETEPSLTAPLWITGKIRISVTLSIQETATI